MVFQSVEIPTDGFGKKIGIQFIYKLRDFSQLRICRPSPLSFVPVLIIDARLAESKEKLIFWFFRFLFFELSRKLGWWRHKNDHNSKNKIFIFLSIKPIPDFSCKFEHLKNKKIIRKKNLFKMFKKFWLGPRTQPKS